MDPESTARRRRRATAVEPEAIWRRRKRPWSPKPSAAERSGPGIQVGLLVPAATNVRGIQSAHRVRAKGNGPGVPSRHRVRKGSDHGLQSGRQVRAAAMPIVHGDRSDRQRKVEAAAREDQAANVGGSRIGRRDREALVAIAAGSRDVRPENPVVGAVAGRPESLKESLEDRADAGGRGGGRPPSGGRKGGGGGSSR